MPQRPAIPSRLPSPSDQLAALIRSCGCPPAHLAAAAQVAPSVLSRFLRGERSLALDTVDRLAAALGGLRLVEMAPRGRGRARPRRAAGPVGGPGPGTVEPAQAI
jgi:Helix-turn-helix